jgi:peptidoglycan/xylan/chitin deacetylase (PgdA/CDA1 family)
VIAVNFSVDFELAWGDLSRAGRDAEFRRKVEAGSSNVPQVLEILETHQIPSTWGIVAACCVSDVDQLQRIAPPLLESAHGALNELQQSCEGWRGLLFRPDLVRSVAASSLVDVGSHGFLHLTPRSASSEMFAEDVRISIRLLQDTVRGPVVSFIPPRNYFWPDQVYAGTGVHFVRHTPRIFLYQYSDPRRGAKFARLWNDLVSPVATEDANGAKAWFVFLRTDRGDAVWRRQRSLLHDLVERREGSLFCYTHPHNLDTAVSLARFGEFCEMVSSARQRERVAYRSFLRQVAA